MAVRLLFVHALTSIHPGTGQGVGTIDLPIARERATNLPYIPGSTLKGCLKAYGLLKDDAARRDDFFGKSDQQGKLRISDARLLLLPVRSLGSTFVWATSPYLLRRFERDCRLLGATEPPKKIPQPNESQAHMLDNAASITVGGHARLVLEDLDFEIRNDQAKDWAEWIADRLFANAPDWRPEFLKRFAILSDSQMDYLSEFATEVNAHVSIEGGTAKDKALWYEESLPAETVLVAIIQERGVNADDAVPQDRAIQFGGNETTGQGIARLVMSGGAE